MNEPIDILDSYADAFRELINARVWQSEQSPKALLRLSDEADWSFICVAMDVVGDATLAIGNFLRFSLDGPTRYDEVGERYLRLYGLLNSTYIQQEAILKLYKLMNCPNPQKVQAEFVGLEVRTVRHQIASHSLDFVSEKGAKPQAFAPIRIGLSGYSCEITENRGDRSRKVALKNAVNEHCRVVASVLDRIYEKAIKTLFKGRENKIAEFDERLKDLRFVRDGNLIFPINGGSGEESFRVEVVKPGERDRD